MVMKVWNTEVVQNKIFPNNLKVADITPIFKKGDSTLEKNYRPVSILPVVSKIFERIMQKQISNYIEKHYHDTYVDIEKDLMPNTLCYLLLKIGRKA